MYTCKSVKQKQIFPTIWTSLENIVLSEISKTQDDKFDTILFLCAIFAFKVEITGTRTGILVTG